MPYRLSRWSPPHRRWFLAGAVLVVIAAQWLALVHMVVHAGGQRLPGAQVSALRGSAASRVPSALLQGVAGHDAGSATCLLLDQLTHATPAAHLPTVLLPVAVPAGPADAPSAPLLPAEWAGFRARGPPVLA